MSRNRPASIRNPRDGGGDRIKSWRAALAAAAIVVLAGCEANGGGGCTMTEVSTLNVLTTRGQPVVRAELDGQPVAYVVDTGAGTSAVFSTVADQLGLPVDYDRRMAAEGAGGGVFVYAATIDRLDFGTAQARHVEFWRIEQPPRTVAGLPVGGLFGGDFLANYDVLFDLPNRRIKLYRAQDCGNAIVPPLPDPLVELPFELEGETRVVVPAKVDDHPIQAILDSGAFRTVLNLDDAHAVGVTDAMLQADPRAASSGIDGRHMTSFLHEFRSLTIGGETRHPAKLAVTDLISPSLIGDDFFRRNQVWISYTHREVFFHPVGAVETLPPPPAPAP